MRDRLQRAYMGCALVCSLVALGYVVVPLFIKYINEANVLGVLLLGAALFALLSIIPLFWPDLKGYFFEKGQRT